MGMNPETKVGIMTATALLALFSLFFWLNRVNFLQKGSELDIVFERIDGLRPGAPVKYMGVDVGRISKIYFENQKIIIRVHIYEGYEVPLTSGAYITSSGVVGDKFVDILPLKAGVTPLSGNRIRGQSPESLDTLYAAANQVMEKLKVTVDSLNQMLGDPKMATSLKNTLANLESLTATANGLIANNASSLNNLVSNATLASDQLASACTSANSLLKDLDANGQTAGDLKEFLTHIKSVSANLESFSVILAEKGPQLGVLADDAHKTMGAITDAAKSVTDTLGAFSSGEGGDQPDLKQTLGQTAAAAQKVSAYVQNFQKMTFANQAGFSYYSTENSDNIAANYQLDMDFDAATALRVGLEDIGHDNLATVQYNMKKPHYSSRVGIYRNQVGVGMDFNAPANHTLGVDLWDTRNATLGLSSRWKLTPVWSMSISAASELEDPSTMWNVGWWRKF